MSEMSDRKKEIMANFERRKYLTLDEKYEMFFINSGIPDNTAPVDAAYAETFRGRVPDILLRFWLDHGWGSWQQGKFWICDPALIQPILDVLFLGDPDYDPSQIVGFAYNSFGKLYVWMGDLTIMRIQWLFNSINFSESPAWNDYGNVPVTDDDRIMTTLGGGTLPTTKGFTEVWTDDDDRDMHVLAIKRLGELPRDHIYGFTPALSAGGPNRVENLQIVPLREHLMFLAAIQTPIIHRYEEPAEGQAGFGNVIPVRPAGPIQE